MTLRCLEKKQSRNLPKLPVPSVIRGGGQEPGALTTGAGGGTTTRRGGWLTGIVGFFCFGFLASRLLLSLFPIAQIMPQECPSNLIGFFRDCGKQRG
jgi:hypothetical protein